jgi:alkyl hydroperoxide reductase subunit AhpF
LIPLQDQESIREKFSRDLVGTVKLDHFTQRQSALYVPGREECPTCDDTRLIMEELAALSDKITLNVYEFAQEREVASRLRVDKIPATVMRGGKNRPISFFGIPSGSEFPGFIDDIVDVSRGKADLAKETVKQLRKLKDDVWIQVFVTPT